MAPWQTAHSMSSAPTLLVADDHPLFRAAVLHVLRERLPQFRTLEAASAATLFGGLGAAAVSTAGAASADVCWDLEYDGTTDYYYC